MKFVKYEGDIKFRSRSKRHNLKELLEGFMSMNVKQVKVTFEEGEYKKPEYGPKALDVAAKRYVLPIDVHFIGGECYLVRRDM